MPKVSDAQHDRLKHGQSISNGFREKRSKNTGAPRFVVGCREIDPKSGTRCGNETHVNSALCPKHGGRPLHR